MWSLQKRFDHFQKENLCVTCYAVSEFHGARLKWVRGQGLDEEKLFSSLGFKRNILSVQNFLSYFLLLLNLSNITRKIHWKPLPLPVWTKFFLYDFACTCDAFQVFIHFRCRLNAVYAISFLPYNISTAPKSHLKLNMQNTQIHAMKRKISDCLLLFHIMQGKTYLCLNYAKHTQTKQKPEDSK